MFVFASFELPLGFVCFDLLFGWVLCYLVLTAWCFGFVLVLFAGLFDLCS